MTQQLSNIEFQQRIVDWFNVHGRQHLPWQKKVTAYRVWVSEIMLQQTQVATVIPYFNRFMARFPNVAQLAKAELDEVLHLWTGLGYYARARNLHKTAQIIHQQHRNRFPNQLQELINLPGIGRSTAGAICALGFSQSQAILDGNVKRVLTRFFAVEGWPGETLVMQRLWKIAETFTPKKHIKEYTQAMMDLGAMICTRTKPQCSQCPLQSHCMAHRDNRETEFPYKKIKKQKPIRQCQFLILQNQQNAIYLEKRPTKGIWGGLWGFPECDTEQDHLQFYHEHYAHEVVSSHKGDTFRHTFTHFHLDITPVYIQIRQNQEAHLEPHRQIWYNNAQPQSLGFAAPVKKLLHYRDKI